jgi:CRISPR/Cas system-associated exonuclease Cas4 (RecB family)
MARSQTLSNILNMVDAAKEELPVERQFLNDLTATIERHNEASHRDPSRTYKPSSLHCIRNMYYQVTGAQGKVDRETSELVGICESGSDRHERIQNDVMLMKDYNVDCEYVDVGKYVESRQAEGLLLNLEVISKQGNETKLYNKSLNMSFLCDGIIRYKKNYYILEIKTEASSKFWDRKNVNPDHILQGTAYALNFDMSDVLFLYECRDNCAKKAYMLHVTDHMKQDLVAKIMECDDCVKSFKCPPVPADVSKKACSFCPYTEICKIS